MRYERPLIVAMSEIAEGVYLASGEEPKHCQSQYMNGTYQRPNPSNIPGATCQYGDLGCRSCPADINWACALQTGDGLQGLDVTGGKLMPKWEYDGHTPTDTYVNTNFNTFNPS